MMTSLSPGYALYWLWVVWYASWLLSIFWSGKAAARPQYFLHFGYQMATMAALILLFGPPMRSMAPYTLWTASDALGWLVFALTALAFAFCWWARITMGRLWSGYISLTADHRVIDTGPFGIVRHPIYSGVIFAAFLMAIELGTLQALAGAAMFFVAFWLKARVEENFLRKELGADAYDAYRRRVPMLVPFGPKSA
jgi:protein-S-isoprenylcysteine O-methyltransferase Ste14